MPVSQIEKGFDAQTPPYFSYMPTGYAIVFVASLTGILSALIFSKGK